MNLAERLVLVAACAFAGLLIAHQAYAMSSWFDILWWIRR